jgi:hypothetical protein
MAWHQKAMSEKPVVWTEPADRLPGAALFL